MQRYFGTNAFRGVWAVPGRLGPGRGLGWVCGGQPFTLTFPRGTSCTQACREAQGAEGGRLWK